MAQGAVSALWGHFGDRGVAGARTEWVWCTPSDAAFWGGQLCLTTLDNTIQHCDEALGTIPDISMQDAFGRSSCSL